MHRPAPLCESTVLVIRLTVPKLGPNLASSTGPPAKESEHSNSGKGISAQPLIVQLPLHAKYPELGRRPRPSRVSWAACLEYVLAGAYGPCRIPSDHFGCHSG